MRYFAAIPVVLILAILDVILLCTILGILILDVHGDYPLTWQFVRGVWGIRP